MHCTYHRVMWGKQTVKKKQILSSNISLLALSTWRRRARRRRRTRRTRTRRMRRMKRRKEAAEES